MPMHNSLADSTLIAVDIASQIASAGVNGTAFDMQGWDGICYVFNLGAMTASGTFDARIMASNTSAFTVNSNITNAALTQVANTSNTNAFVIDVYRPTLRYIKSVTTPAVANTQFAVTAIRYRRSGILPPTASALQTVKVAQN